MLNPKALQALFQAKQAAQIALAQRQAQQALVHLERAHVLGQRLNLEHASVHWLMLRAGWQLKDWREVLGQIPRIAAALLFSRIWVPLGNTGRARVSAFAPMPLSEELRRLLQGR